MAVLTTRPLGKPLDYLAPEEGCRLGAFVEAPLGPRREMGVVWGTAVGDWPVERLRRLAGVVDAPPMRAEMRDFLSRVAEYTLTPLPAVLRLATRSPGLGEALSTRKVYRRGDGLPDRMTDARVRVMEALDGYGGAAVTMRELTGLAGVGSSVVKGLVGAGAIREEDMPRDTPYPRMNASSPGKELAPDQAAAAAELREGIRSGKYGTTLLKGVTGSGKTEVYLEAVAECLRAERQALVLLPEIALTAEFLNRVEERFGARPAEWHSGATASERRRAWRMVAEGGAELAVGARSALFLPFRDLGLIVVDEEHDTSYKQEDGVFYNARDMAVLRASIAGARVILASATPSLETWANAERGKYSRLDLTSRFGEAVLPRMRAVDMRAESMPAKSWISPTLAEAAEARIAEGEQAMFFLNRRGYAPITVCRGCGHQIGCAQCDARMVEHRFQSRLVCHQCGDSLPVPEACPKCGVEGRLSAVGPGVERLAEEAAARFPDARVAVLSSDLFGSASGLKERIEEIAQGGADIVIGTQIVAKGHNFPLLTLVGVIDADLGLKGSDLRAAERTFQLVRQAAGRAGRAERPGTALIQTHQPDHPVIRAIIDGEDEAFWRAEAEGRMKAGVPPYGRMVGIILSSTDVKEVFDTGNALARADGPIRRIGAEVLGPAPAPIARIKGWHRARLLVKSGRTVPLQAAVAEWLGRVKIPSGLRLSIDVDPQSFH